MTGQAIARIDLLSFDYPPNDGGIARLSGELARALSRENTVGVVTGRQSRNSMRTDVPSVATSHGPASRPAREVWALRELLRRRPDLVISSTWYPEGCVATAARVQNHVVLAHGAELLPVRGGVRRPIWRVLQRKVLERASLVIANSEYTATLVRESSPQAQVAWIPLAVDVDRFTPGDRVSARERLGVSDRFVVSTVSRLQPHKGHLRVLEALARLPTACRRDLVYLIGGRGPQEAELARRVEALGLENSVRFLGFVDETALLDVYRASDLFVMLSEERRDLRAVEGFGLVFLEAQACGTPVVGSRQGGIPSAITPGEAGWLIGDESPDELASFVEARMSDPSLVDARTRARERVLERFTWERYTTQFEALLAQHGLV